MKSAIFTKTKSGKVLEVIEVATPVPRDNEVLIKTRAASVNPLDWRLKRRRPGVDVAGEVVRVGGRITRFKPGDAVFGTCRGAFAEYAATTEAALALKPEKLTFDEAAALPVAGLTALQGLRDKGRLEAGQKVLINGAAGGVGTFAIQIAKSMGADVTGVCSTRNIEMVRSLGAHQVVDYTKQDFTKSNERYDLLLDNVGNRALSAFRRVMTPRGRCVLVGMPTKLVAVARRLVKALVWSPFLRQKFTFFVAKLHAADLELLCELMKTGKLTAIIDRRYSLSEAGQAVTYVEQGHARAKVILISG